MLQLGGGSSQAQRWEPGPGLEAGTFNDVAEARVEGPELSLTGDPRLQAGGVHECPG